FDSLAQLMMVLDVAECGVFVEPFRAKRFRRVTGALATISQPNAHGDHRLPTMGGRHDAEAERHAKLVGPFAPDDLDDLDARGVQAGTVREASAPLEVRPSSTS